MAKEIKIAPDMEEIKREGNVLTVEFNNMKIKWCIGDDCSDIDESTEQALKQWLQTAIGLAGKMWQVPYMLNKHLPFPSIVYVNGKTVEYPKD